MNTSHAEVIKQAAARSSDFERGIVEGESRATARLLPQVEKLAADAVATIQAENREAEILRGQVTAQYVLSLLEKFSGAMKLGLCWRCGTNKPDEGSAYQLCSTCPTDH